MNLTAESALRKIGSQLDQQIYPRVRNGGIVTPSEIAVPSTVGEENAYANRRESGSATGPWERSARGEGSSGRSRSTGRSGSPSQTAPLVRASVEAYNEDELTAVCEAYPGTRVWRGDDGLWLLVESSILSGLRRAAIFVVRVSYANADVRAWGFWRHSLILLQWIGPRHTNFPDGSICAFHPDDGVWNFGDRLDTLLDLYTVWALRHLHLEVVGRWPGPQAAFHPYERISELRADEYCGCGTSDQRYRDCCRDKDLGRNRVADALDFLKRHANGVRQPSRSILQLAHGVSGPPNVTI